MSAALSIAVLGVLANLALTHVLSDVDLFWRVLAIGASWLGGFVYCYGWDGLRTALFPCIALLFVAPMPESWMHLGETAMQYASADVSDALFRLVGSTVYREGMVFFLPGLTVEVARECSGIRSTTALVLVVAVGTYPLLRKPWSRLAFFLLAIPVGIFKNAVRITTLAWLGSNVSPEYLWGWLHKQGGPPVTMVALAILVLTLLLLQRLEREEKPPLLFRQLDQCFPRGLRFRTLKLRIIQSLLDEAEGFPVGGAVWLADNNTSRCLRPNNGSTAGGADTDPVGTYVWQQTFTSNVGAGAKIIGRWASDNEGIFTFNGNTVSTTPIGGAQFQQWHSFTIYGGFNNGLNTLLFTVNNRVGPGRTPTGLRVELSPVFLPEPVEVFSTAGLLGLAFFAARRRLGRA